MEELITERLLDLSKPQGSLLRFYFSNPEDYPSQKMSDISAQALDPDGDLAASLFSFKADISAIFDRFDADAEKDMFNIIIDHVLLITEALAGIHIKYLDAICMHMKSHDGDFASRALASSYLSSLITLSEKTTKIMTETLQDIAKEG